MERNKETATKTCGRCQRFDIRDCAGNTVGSVDLKNGEGLVRKGFCREEKGLILGILNENSECKQPLEYLGKNKLNT